jgi:molybdopterin converting factor small subunit
MQVDWIPAFAGMTGSMEGSMRVEVSFWGVTRRLAGADTLMLDLPADSSVEVLAGALAAHGHLASELERCAFAIGDTLVPRSHPLSEGEQVAVLPPVSGG